VSGEKPARAGSNIGAHIKSFVDRIEALETEKKNYADDIRDVYKEAKENGGLDTAVLRAIVKLRRQDKAKRQEFEAVLDEYMAALGMID
jgi:uncharacterized protein (UPF0335 family)